MNTHRPYLHYSRMRALVRLSYRGDFLVGAIGDLLVAGIGIVFLFSLFAHIPDIRGWTAPEVLFIWGMAEAGAGLFFMVFQGLWLFNQRYLLHGELDRVLLRPLDPLAQILMDHLNLEKLPVFALGLAMMAYALVDLPPPTLLQWVCLPLFLLSSAAILGGVLTAVSAVGFAIHTRGTGVGLVYQGSAFNRYPLDLFGDPVRWLFTVLLPFGFCAYYPATWYMGHGPLMPMLQLIVGPAALGVGVFLWRKGLGRYRSTGS